MADLRQRVADLLFGRQRHSDRYRRASTKAHLQHRVADLLDRLGDEKSFSEQDKKVWAGEVAALARIHYGRESAVAMEAERRTTHADYSVFWGYFKGLAHGLQADLGLPPIAGERVFIGHGRSSAWRDLKDFVQDRLDLPWDEFNREPTAGYTTKERLQQMLDEAAFAFLVMTAEDEQADGAWRARENVVHEARLLQGRLGFRKAIVLLEEGCEEFPNILGIGQIRFPEGNISARFDEIRRVLEREKILTP